MSKPRGHDGHTYEDQMHSGVYDALEYCQICLRKLDQPDDPSTLSCGGDCLRCMAEIGDPDCIEQMRKLNLPFKEF